MRAAFGAAPAPSCPSVPIARSIAPEKAAIASTISVVVVTLRFIPYDLVYG